MLLRTRDSQPLWNVLCENGFRKLAYLAAFGLYYNVSRANVGGCVPVRPGNRRRSGGSGDSPGLAPLPYFSRQVFTRRRPQILLLEVSKNGTGKIFPVPFIHVIQFVRVQFLPVLHSCCDHISESLRRFAPD